MARFFTLTQAESLLPSVEPAIRSAISLKSEYQGAERVLHSMTQRIQILGGSMADRDSFVDEKKRRDSAARRLKDAIEQIQSFGCLIKDLDIGLIDFPSLYRGEEVYLCWKLGEDGINFWHGVSEGFGGRKPIDREFLDNHKGDSPN